jgi:hypothetical protein
MATQTDVVRKKYLVEIAGSGEIAYESDPLFRFIGVGRPDGVELNVGSAARDLEVVGGIGHRVAVADDNAPGIDVLVFE